MKKASWEGHRRLQQAYNVVELWWVTWRCKASGGFGLDEGMNKFPMSSIHCEAYGCPPNLMVRGSDFGYFGTDMLRYALIFIDFLLQDDYIDPYGHITMWSMVWFILPHPKYPNLTSISIDSDIGSSLLSPRKRAPEHWSHWSQHGTKMEPPISSWTMMVRCLWNPCGCRPPVWRPGRRRIWLPSDHVPKLGWEVEHVGQHQLLHW